MPQGQDGQLVKAKLSALDGDQADINFMFNPTHLKFKETVQTAESPGARTEHKGDPKVSFSHTKSRIITLSNITFDTYETGQNVRDIIVPFLKAVRFAPGQQRPPIYVFMWGSELYFRRCFVEQIDYSLTMFLPNGTPVRAVIDSLSLKEADDPKAGNSISTPNISPAARQADSLAGRSEANKLA